MKSNLIFSYLIICCIVTSGCVMNYPQYMIEGDWDAYQGIQIMDGDFINLSFHNNQFCYTYEQFSDVAIPCVNNPDPNGFTAREYAEGVFEIRENILILNGTWLDKSCYNKGEFIAVYKIKILSLYPHNKKIEMQLINFDGSNQRGLKNEVLIIM